MALRPFRYLLTASHLMHSPRSRIIVASSSCAHFEVFLAAGMGAAEPMEGGGRGIAGMPWVEISRPFFQEEQWKDRRAKAENR